MKLFGCVITGVIFIVCVFPISVSASFILLDNFETSELSQWRPFTNDDNPENGWVIRGGMAIQSAVNNDEQTIGGERFLIRENVLDLRRVKFPINIRLDIFPLDYKEPNEVWFGFGFMANPDAPQKDSVVVALRKDEGQKKSGLHIGIGGQRWLAEPNNFEFVVMKWHRLNLQIDKAEAEGGLRLRAKVWVETEPEPAEWMTEARLLPEQINLSARGILLGTKASWGKKGNPRAGFDNLIITCGETRIPDNIFFQSADRICEGVLSLFKPELAEELRERVEQIGPQNPNYCGYDRALFLEMLALRNIARWAEARDKANELIALFPASPYTARMGGKDGRTEDQAAVEFSKCMKAYHDRNYDEARPLFLKFVEDYPNNWRRDHALFLAAECLYLSGKEQEFGDDVNTLINLKKIGYPYNANLVRLQTAILIREGKGEQARQLLDYLEQNYPTSRFKDEFRQMRLESYLGEKNLDKLSTDTTTLLIVDRLFETVLEDSRELRDIWYKKNLVFGIKYFRKTGRDKETAKFLEREMEINLKVDKPQLYFFVVKEYMNYLIKVNKKEEGIGIAIKAIEEHKNNCKERNELIEFIAQFYYQEGNRERARQILEYRN